MAPPGVKTVRLTDGLELFLCYRVVLIEIIIIIVTRLLDSVTSLWGQLMSTSESWGVYGHTTRCISPVSMVL